MEEKAEFIHVSRVNQLDAIALDNEVFNLVKGSLSQALQFLNTRSVTNLQPEINAILKYLIWDFTIGENGASIGQKMLDLEYVDSKTFKTINTSKRKLLMTLDIFGSWLNQRITSNSLLSHLSLEQQNKVLMYNNIVTLVTKVASVLNFLVFLKNGKYQSVLERLLQIRSGNSNPQMLRQVQYEYMNRELLWHGFAEFICFALPLINIYRLKNTILRLLWSKKQVETSHSVSNVEIDFALCAFCNETPNRPCEFGCRHVFCYYCIAGNLKADAKFSCPKCFKQAVDGLNSLRPVSIT